MSLHVFKDCGESTFGSGIVINSCVCDEVIRVLVDRIVRQMHIEIVEILLLRTYVGLCGESCESLFVDKNSEWFDTINEAIDTQVKLQIVNKVRLCHVALGNKLVTRLEVNVFETSG